MLFADCRGFTTLMHARGPEAVKPLIDAFFRKCSEVVISQDGIVDPFLGDAALAFFNAPIRHEDHVARAVTVATQIQLGVLRVGAVAGEEGPLEVGIGISTGLAFTGTVGSNDCKDYTAIGDVVNIAARLQGHAEPGEVLVTEEVYKAVGRAFPNARERLVELKGIPKPVRAYALS